MSVPQTHIGSTFVPHNLDFAQQKIAQSTTGTLNIIATLATAGTLNAKDYIMPFAGSIYAIGMSLSEVPTDGTLTVTPLINGSLTAFNVDTTVSDVKVQRAYATQEARKFQSTFAAGDRVGLRYLTDSAFAPNTNIDGVFQVLVLFENVNL